MNHISDSFYVASSFRTSKEEFFPQNTVDKFYFKFDKALRLTGGEWKVGLSDINFINSNSFLGGLKPSHYLVNFSNCEGLIIDGQSSRTLRILPHPVPNFINFGKIFYLSINTLFIDTCELFIKPICFNKNISFHFEEDSEIIVTLHFRKVQLF